MTSLQSSKQSSHTQRLLKWRNLASAQGKFLIDLVIEQLVPSIEALGFERIDVSAMGPDHRPSGSEICFERRVGDELFCITVNFDKYGTPRCQIRGICRSSHAPYLIIRAANLVQRRSQYYWFWGKPWWLPTRWWPNCGSTRAISAVTLAIPQLVHFLESGVRGANISKDVHQP